MTASEKARKVVEKLEALEKLATRGWASAHRLRFTSSDGETFESYGANDCAVALPALLAAAKALIELRTPGATLNQSMFAESLYRADDAIEALAELEPEK